MGFMNQKKLGVGEPPWSHHTFVAQTSARCLGKTGKNCRKIHASIDDLGETYGIPMDFDGHSDQILISSTVSGLWVYLKIGYPQIHG